MAKHLEFMLEGQSYAIPVETVWSIMQLPTIVKMPRLPSYVLGTMIFYGQATPIIDLRAFWKLPQKALTDRTLAIDIHIDDSFFAILADEVIGLVDVDAHNIKRRDGMEQDVASSYIDFNGRAIMLLDVQLLQRQLQYCR